MTNYGGNGNKGRWMALLEEYVCVRDKMREIVVFGRLSDTNYEASSLLPYVRSVSTSKTNRLEFVKTGDPFIVNEDVIGHIYPVTLRHIQKYIRDFNESSLESKKHTDLLKK